MVGLDNMLPSLQRSSPATGHGTLLIDIDHGKPVCCLKPESQLENLSIVTLRPVREAT
jgi:hypothetical protein